MREKKEFDKENINIPLEAFSGIQNSQKKIDEDISALEKFLQGKSYKEIDKLKKSLMENTTKSLKDSSLINQKLQQIYNALKTPEARRLEELDKVFSLDKYVFFLGGMDSEMAGIQRILDKENIKYNSKNLAWGAKASDYDQEIKKCVTSGYIPVLIELEGAKDISECINIDHHGDFAGRDPSIIQSIFGIIYRKEVLLGINDAEYIGGLIEKGATEEEINALREIDRINQGITLEEEKEGQEAIKKMERFEDFEDLIIVKMNHSKVASVADRLFVEQYNKKGQNLLVISEIKKEINYVATNKILLIKELEEKFGGWSGGKEPNKYWGVNKEVNPNMPEQEEIVEFIKNYLKNNE